MSYAPTAEALLNSTWYTAALSQRDLSLRVPLNFVTYPGVSTTKACFGDGVYNEVAAVLCFSNLLAMSIRHYELDLYWHRSTRDWSFCPIELPVQNSQISSNSLLVSNSSITSVNPTATAFPDATITARFAPLSYSLNGDHLSARQLTSPSSTAIVASTGPGSSSNNASPSAAVAAAVSGTPNTFNITLAGGVSGYAAGPYACSHGVNFPLFTNVLEQYLRNSSNTLAALMTFLRFNIHVASSANSPMTPANALLSGESPSNRSLISEIITTNLSSFLYTPQLLRNDRANLNRSWYSVDDEFKPIQYYYDVQMNDNGDVSTKTGWPSESYVEFKRKFRVMATYGSIDPQFSFYNSAIDADVMFTASDLYKPRVVDYIQSGDMDQGCFYNSQSTDLSQVNNSWAATTNLDLLSTHMVDGVNLFSSLSNLTSCGISPVLNSTLSNTSAAADPLTYKAYSESTLWSWLPGEPRNISTSDPNSDRMRCAVMDLPAASSSDSLLLLDGRWRVANCDQNYHAACRVQNSPYSWRISSSPRSYDESENACPAGTTFSVPNTGLENTYLVAATREQYPDGISLFVNLNSLSLANCWVTGIGTICPYLGGQTVDLDRRIIVPVVAGVLVLVIAALTVFVKCAANRRNEQTGRKRKRVDDGGWHYEGVPS